MITCYAQPDKAKSRRLLQAFAAGCGAAMASTLARELQPGAAAFYGVRPPWLHLWQQARREARTVYWLDNCWFDRTRESQFRIGVNAMQSWSQRPSDGRRFAALGVPIQPWRNAGRHVLVCGQSDEFMTVNAEWPGGHLAWCEHVASAVRARSDRPLVYRKKQAAAPLAVDLADAWLLVTHSSAAAIEALLAGVPVIVTDRHCAAAELTSRFDEIENPHRPDNRRALMERLADSQWTLDELRNGMAWRMMNG